MAYEKNISGIDRILRVIIAIILLFVAFNKSLLLGWQYFLYFVSFFLVITAIFGWCGVYAVLGFCSTKGKCLNKITKKDIEKAIEDYGLDENSNLEIEQIKASNLSDKKKVVKKKQTKKVSKKVTSKKVATKKVKKVAKKKVTTKKVKK